MGLLDLSPDPVDLLGFVDLSPADLVDPSPADLVDLLGLVDPSPADLVDPSPAALVDLLLASLMNLFLPADLADLAPVDLVDLLLAGLAGFSPVGLVDLSP